MIRNGKTWFGASMGITQRPKIFEERVTIGFKVLADSVNKTPDLIKDVDEAIQLCRNLHHIDPYKFHAVHRVMVPVENEYTSWGIHQLKPYDCIHGFPKGTNCDKCDPDARFDADRIYTQLMPCHKDSILLCHVRIQPEHCPTHCGRLAEEDDTEYLREKCIPFGGEI